jgi:iron complex transport system substrate-binding protein
MKYILLLSLFVLTLFAHERIVSLSPSITEIVYALGSGEDLVATSTYSLYPNAAKKLPVVGSYTNPNIEKILAFSPTLVIGQTFNAKTLMMLHTLKIKTIMLHLKTIKEIQNAITLLGHKLNKESQAKKVVKQINEAITNIHKTDKPHTVMIVYGLKEDLRSGIYIAGKGIFFDDIITLSGNKNCYTNDKISQPVLNYENVIALNPDQIIILHSHATEPNVNVKQALKNWYALPTNASRNGKISIVDEDYLHIPSQRVALTITRLVREMND